MRKVIITMHPNSFMKLASKLISNPFKLMDHMEGKAILRIDMEKGQKVVVTDIIMKDGHTLDDLKWPKYARILDVLKVAGNRHTCLMKIDAPKSMKPFVKLFNFDVIYDLPYYASEDKVIFSFIGENEPIQKAIKALRTIGKIESIQFQKATFREYDSLACLTEKQKEVITAAKRKGYYDYPRQSSTNELADELGISRATTIEHLRKAEGRLMEEILAGY